VCVWLGCWGSIQKTTFLKLVRMCILTYHKDKDQFICHCNDVSMTKQKYKYNYKTK